MTKKVKWFFGSVGLFVIVAVVLAFSLRETILVKAGKFMAPEDIKIEGIADVVILEGTGTIGKGVVSKGVELLSMGKAKRMVIVLHNIGKNHWPFAFQEDYPSSVRKELQKLGLKDSDFTVIVTPIRNPVTLTSAKGALKILARDGVKKAILVSPGFHMRRSFLIYQHLSIPLNIKIYPVVSLDKYQLNNWWNHDNGPRDFLLELQKLALYIAKGYIPPKLSY
jgi:uncharacterized SAM-binding protein YcdF (DUF218 family)